MDVLTNVSTSMTTSTYVDSSGHEFVYLGVPTSSVVASRDYKSFTYGIQTTCQPISQKCNLQAVAGAYTPFYCTEAFQGDVTSSTQEGEDPNWSLIFFPNPSLTSNDTILSGVQNPFWFGLAALVDGQELFGYQIGNGPNDPNLVVSIHDGVAFVVLCSSTVYDIHYTSINSSSSRECDWDASNNSVANIFQRTMAITNFGTPYLQEAAFLAGLSPTSDEVAGQMGLSFSNALLAGGAQVLQSTSAIAARERSSVIVARIPKAPLFTAIILDLLFAVIGMLFSVWALASSSGDRNSEVRDVQAKLGIVGLVADRFEDTFARQGITDLKVGFEEFAGAGLVERFVLEMTAARGWEFGKR